MIAFPLDNKFFFLRLYLFFCFFASPLLNGQQSSDYLGSVSIVIKGGSSSAPYHSIISPALKGKAVFRGQVESVVDNNLSFYTVPDLLDPTTLSKPFKEGLFTSQKARVRAVLSDSNASIDRVEVVDPGAGYAKIPNVFIHFPSLIQGSSGDAKSAFAIALTANSMISSVSLTDSGMGYSSIPKVEIEGGPHFLRVVDLDSNHTGRFYRISSNSANQLTVENLFNEDLTAVFPADSEVEIFEAWTLGELFGYESTSFNDIDSSTGNIEYDHVYLLSPSNSQNGTESDFEGFYHDGGSWKRLNSPSVDANHQVISPNQSLVVARRSSSDLNLLLSGTALAKSTYISVPNFSKRVMLSNPYGVDLMLSDLIDTTFITEDNSTSFMWLANPEQEKADNVKVLHDGVWSTFWHDGKNKSISAKATATPRAGSGAGASLMQRDISFSEGLIIAMTNPSYASGDNVLVTSPNHRLREGFVVKIIQARGYKTNDLKELVDDLGNVVDNNSSALIIESGANGYYTVKDVTTDSFVLDGKSGDCNFINDGSAMWITGTSGSGYEHDCSVSFIGGGGSGASGIARVDSNTGQVISISITSAGSGYIEEPDVVIHSGGWRKLGAGNSPFSDLLIPAGGGIMIVRNHPNGQPVRFPVRNPFD